MFDIITFVGQDHWSGKAEKSILLRRQIKEFAPQLTNFENYPTGECASDVLRKSLVGNRQYVDDGEPEEGPVQYLVANGSGKGAIDRVAKTASAYADWRVTAAPPAESAVWQYLTSQSVQWWKDCEIFEGARHCFTARGYFGFVPDETLVGDVVCCIFGCNVPFVLRRCEGETTDGQPLYTLVGKCYIHGIMEGEQEAFKDLEQTDIYLI